MNYLINISFPGILLLSALATMNLTFDHAEYDSGVSEPFTAGVGEHYTSGVSEYLPVVSGQEVVFSGQDAIDNELRNDPGSDHHAVGSGQGFVVSGQDHVFSRLDAIDNEPRNNPGSDHLAVGSEQGFVVSGHRDDKTEAEVDKPQVQVHGHSFVTVLSPPVSGRNRNKPIIGVAGISHESNSFRLRKSELEDFGARFDEDPDERVERFFSRNRSQSLSAGLIEGAERYGLELYPAFLTGTRPMGPVTDHAFNTLMEELIRQLENGPELDGILLPLHGAMVVESYPSGDEEIIRRVREAFGPDIPIVVTHDFHANITPASVELSDVLITYKENPHLDTFDRGLQATEIMDKIVRGEINPVQAIEKPPMVYNIVFQSTFREPLLPITDESKRLEQHENILAVSVAGGYQYADVEWMGPSVVVVTDNDPELAGREAKRLSDMLWETRHETVLDKPEPAEAVRQAMEHDGRPVVLIDMGDNIGGGSTGDSTFLLEEFLKQDAQGWVMVIADREAYDVAEEAGIGEPFDFEVGGKTDSMHGDPVRVQGHVRSLHVGRYYEPEVRHGGGMFRGMSHTAVIHVDGSTLDEPNLLLITQNPSSPNSAHQIISNGVYVERQKMIVAKGAIAPRAAYEPIASKIIPVDSPGATAVNPAWFEYHHVREGIFGLGQDR